MPTQLNKLAAALLVAGAFAPGLAHATDGYFQPGYSVKSVGMGGVGIALPQDSLIVATNPAGLSSIGTRADIGVSLFQPNRSATMTMPGGSMSFDGNDQSNFVIPELGYSRAINDKLTVGIAMYGNGGMNSGYSNLNSATRGAQCGNPMVLQKYFGGSAAACMGSPMAAYGAFGLGPMGVDLQQLFISPSLAWRINDQNSVGIALNIVHQSFRSNGIDAFAGMSVSPQNVTGNGHDSSDGLGFRLGWQGQITPSLTLGATYQPKTHMGTLDKYKGMFPSGGHMDIPANYGIGMAWRANDKLTVAADLERIDYGDIPAIANTQDCVFMGQCQLGQPNGGGFGWQSINVYKLGVAYQFNPAWTLRAGYNHSDQPVPTSQVMVNVLSPGVVQDHLTLGATYALSKSMELSFDWAHAFSKTVTGTGLSQGTSISMHEDTFGIALGYKY